MAGKPDPRPSKRVKNIDAVEQKMMFELRCRACNWSGALEAHHLVNRSQGGDDTGDNIVGLCRACHHTLTHRGGKASQRVRERIRRHMQLGELRYCEQKKSLAWLDEHYPDSARVGVGTGTGSEPLLSTEPVPAPENPGCLSSGKTQAERGRSADRNSVERPQPGPSMRSEDLEKMGIKAANTGAEIQPSESIPSEPPYWLEGKQCPTCHRRVNHKKKKTSPTSAVFSHRGPVDSKDEYNEIIEASAKHGGMTTEEKFWKHEYDLRMAAVNLAGPPGQLVKKP